jgi:glycosyltransferase involved in cell wall biosynthesis
MACGVPVVGSAVGGLLDSIAHRSTGLLVPARDPDAVAAAIGRLLDNPSLRVHMGAEAAARVRQEFTWDLVARSMLQVYEKLRTRRPLPSSATSWAVTA